MPKIAKSGHSIPAPRKNCVLNYHRGFLYLWGGALFKSNAGAILYRYDLGTNEWELVKDTGTLP